MLFYRYFYFHTFGAINRWGLVFIGMKALIYLGFFAIWLLLAFLVGKLGAKRKLGYDKAFLISLFGTPFISAALVLLNGEITNKTIWWKVLSVISIFYVLVAGFILPVPALDILNETIRNLYFHVTMWFGMMILFTISLFYSVKYLQGFDLKHDTIAHEMANVGLFLGFLGITTGSVWANYTWGAPWVNDVKLNGAAITIMIYVAYLILRSSIEDEDKKAKVAAVYNIFAFVLLIVFVWVLPRMTDSLHPGNGGNPGFSQYEEDLDSTMRMVFYPAIIGWTLLALWIAQIRLRLTAINNHLDQNESHNLAE